MEFDFVTWSVWSVGFIIWIIWAYLSIKEFISILIAQKKELDNDND
ncbi:hypothetical protein SAMN05443144_1364 [Fodinibius roseus]|uniref:CcmD family protein n=1 Tax=Fodinibius roseus TaxID=1194090 RepID=A0A1M5L0U8_9BACT|nr:hypothetical protein SAMN05443144_1364 [Fodinibius roseus]